MDEGTMERKFKHLEDTIEKMKYRIKGLQRDLDIVNTDSLSDARFLDIFLRIELIDNLEDLMELGDQLQNDGEIPRHEALYFSLQVRAKFNLLMIEKLDVFVSRTWRENGGESRAKKEVFEERGIHLAKKGNILSLIDLKKGKEDDGEDS